MNNLSTYIIEKLHLDKNIKLNNIPPTKEEFINKLEEYINSLDNTNNLDLKYIWPDTKDRPTWKDTSKQRIKIVRYVSKIWTKNNILLASYGSGTLQYNYDYFTDEQKLLIYNYITKELEKNE